MLSNTRLLSRFLLLLILVTVLTSCGFHLRSSVPVPSALKETKIIGVAEYSPLGLQLKRTLTSAGSTVLEQNVKTLSSIKISQESFTRRVLSVDAQGRVAEYALTYTFDFNVSDATGAVLVPDQKIELHRDYRFDPNNVLAKDAEEKQIRSDMVYFAVRQMMRRIDAILKRKE